ncbi:type I restriction enzyme S subunit [Arcicella aurantiaca]|uniref:Type I restriction enzyme S subunit n=1 Tax=Arcicella aurantiaca TaxID=591202 RepID=A0A316DFH1_9BACT|nr:restriction endonuclease subunit S [Arcicella aurantiaca]PWK16951.1 type I restriction enzyme S subunit [Arcicella aurantiaca]
MEKQNNIPRLRFPEFTNDWEIKKLGAIAEKINSGKTPLGGESVYTEEGILFIRSQNVKDNLLSYENATYIPEDVNDSMKNSIVKSKDILLNITGASLGRSCVVPEEFTIGNVNQHVCIIRINKNNEPFFIQPILSSEKGQNLFLSLQTGSGREGLNFQSIKGIELSFPTLPEQQKIATFLSTVDEKLQALKKKKSLLETYKKGAMQKLFSQNIRFKDDEGNDFEDWEVKTLGEVANITMGQSPSSNSYNSENMGIALIQGNADIQNRLSSPRNWTTEITKECKIGDLILTVRAPVGAVAKSIHNACIGRGVCAISNTSDSNIEYIYQFLLDFETKWSSLEQGSTFTAVSGVEIKKLGVNLPTLPEQTKIANFLTAIDEKIDKVDTQIKQTELWKKGLLQQMFV